MVTAVKLVDVNVEGIDFSYTCLLGQSYGSSSLCTCVGRSADRGKGWWWVHGSCTVQARAPPHVCPDPTPRAQVHIRRLWRLGRCERPGVHHEMLHLQPVRPGQGPGHPARRWGWLGCLAGRLTRGGTSDGGGVHAWRMLQRHSERQSTVASTHLRAPSPRPTAFGAAWWGVASGIIGSNANKGLPASAPSDGGISAARDAVPIMAYTEVGLFCLMLLTALLSCCRG